MKSRAARPAPALSPRGRAKKVSLTVDEGVLAAIERDAKKSKRTTSRELTAIQAEWLD